MKDFEQALVLAAALWEIDSASLSAAFDDAPASMKAPLFPIRDRLIAASIGHPALQAVFEDRLRRVRRRTENRT